MIKIKSGNCFCPKYAKYLFSGLIIEVSGIFCLLASQINQAILVFSGGISNIIYIYLIITFCFS